MLFISTKFFFTVFFYFRAVWLSVSTGAGRSWVGGRANAAAAAIAAQASTPVLLAGNAENVRFT
jgi:hypothetical protein